MRPRGAGFSGFGRLPTDRTAAASSRPSDRAPCATDGTEQAPHINVCLLSRGLLRQIYTRIYFEGDPALAADPILALVPADGARHAPARGRRRRAGPWDFVIRLQGDDETVFFDL